MIKKFKLLKKFIEKKDPYLIKRIIRGVYENFLRLVFKFSFHKGIKILDEEWKYLILLDACRYDEFKRINWIKGNLKKKISLGSNTPEWLRKNFKKSCKDIIYVAGNPQMSKIIRKDIFNNFFKIEKVWDYGWNFKLNTVLPNKLTKATLKLSKKYPDKRFIIHYLQPHAPYINPNTKDPELVKRMEVIQDNVLFGNLDIKKVKRAWQENLKFVLKEIDKNLIPKIKGKIIITADHGEAFGEKFLYFHPEAIYTKELIEVPWLIINKPNSRNKEQNKKRIEKVIESLKI